MFVFVYVCVCVCVWFHVCLYIILCVNACDICRYIVGKNIEYTLTIQHVCTCKNLCACACVICSEAQRGRESRAPESVSQRDRANEEGGVRGLRGGDEFISNVLLRVYACMDVLCLYTHTFIYSTYIICIHVCKYEYLHTQIHRKTSIGIHVHRCVHVYKCVSMCTHKGQGVTHLQAINVHKYISYVYTVCCSGQRTSIKQER